MPHGLNIVLVEPQIPQNTGSIGRLCLATQSALHLIEPLGFPLEDSKLKRAGLDYHEYARMKVHPNWQAFIDFLQPDPARLFALTTHGSALFSEARFQAGDVFVFGSETKGLDTDLRNSFPASQRIRLPMQPENRSLNLSNTVAVVVYEAWRQNGFAGGA